MMFIKYMGSWRTLDCLSCHLHVYPLDLFGLSNWCKIPAIKDGTITACDPNAFVLLKLLFEI